MIETFGQFLLSQTGDDDEEVDLLGVWDNALPEDLAYTKAFRPLSLNSSDILLKHGLRQHLPVERKIQLQQIIA